MSAARRLAASAAVLALVAGGALAQDVLRVRAGEHAGHTRLVVDARTGQPLAWGIEGRTLLVKVGGSGFDTASIGRNLTRVSGLSASDGVLRVGLTCDCGVRVQRLGDGRIVLDVAEGAPRPAPPADLATASAGPAQPQASAAAPQAEPVIAPASPTTAASLAGQSGAAPSAPAATEPRGAPAQSGGPVPVRPPSPAPTPRPARTATAGEAAPAPVRAGQQPAVTPPSEAPAAEAVRADGHVPLQAAEPAAAAPPPAEPPAGAAPPPSLPATDAAAATVEAARQQLLRQLTRAAEEGLLTLARPPEAAPEAPSHAAPPAPEAVPDAAALPVRALTAEDLSRQQRAQRPTPGTQPDVPAHCLPERLFNVAAWSSDAPVMLQIGAQRRSIVGEFDAANPDAVLAYVRLLLAHGFGLEAQGALQAFALDLPPVPHLWDLARLVDGEPVAADSAIGSGLDCPGPHHAWAIAAAAMDGRLDPEIVDLDAIRDPLAALPPRLRTRLIVPVASALLEADLIDRAESLAGLAARAEPPPPDGDGMLTVLLARIDAARGDWRRAEAGILPLVTHNSPAGIEAMIRLVEFRLARRLAPPPGLAENMEAVAFTLGSDPLGRRLLRAAASARAAGEGLGLALGALRSLAERGGDAGSATAAARDMLVDYTPDPAEGAAYAEAVLAYETLLGADAESDRARIAIARNFMVIGLENLADRMLAPALARGVPAARLTAAEAATAAWDAPRALELLDGLAGDRAARARAEALFSMGDFAGAAAAAAETGDRTLEARYAWLAGNWAAAAAAGDVDRRILAAWMSGAGEMPAELRAAAEADPALASRMDAFTRPAASQQGSLLDAAGTALEDSRRRRALMGELLSDG